jgi:outer membrane murein-binding lipoprotein Lpp
MQLWSREVRLIFAVLAMSVIGLTVLAGCGSSSKRSAAETPASEAEINELADEVEEEEAEGAEEAMNPSIPHGFEEMLIAHPQNEESTRDQLEKQIVTNEEHSDPAHEAQASCSYLSEHAEFINFSCLGFTVGSTNSAMGQIEVTVNRNTGEVLVGEG